VALEEVPREDWAEKVYKNEIRAHWKQLYKSRDTTLPVGRSADAAVTIGTAEDTRCKNANLVAAIWKCQLSTGMHGLELWPRPSGGEASGHRA